MNSLFDMKPEKRKDEILKLKSYMLNPGYFSILLLGERGTGKSFWIDEIVKKNKNIGEVLNINAFLAEDKKEYWAEQLKKSDNGILVIDEVEKLTKINQELLFQAMQTTNGKYGFEKKEYRIRIIFTSIFDITTLKNSEKYLSHKFFDRIGQFILQLPSFQSVSSNIEADFAATWEKLTFTTKKKIPKNKIIEWLNLNADRKLKGNFRDLDKICINWHNYRLLGYKEDDIYELIINDFSKYLKYPEHKTETHDEFHFSNEMTHDEIMKGFKQQYKKWAKREYVNLKIAGKKLGISHRTMERW